MVPKHQAYEHHRYTHSGSKIRIRAPGVTSAELHPICRYSFFFTQMKYPPVSSNMACWEFFEDFPKRTAVFLGISHCNDFSTVGTLGNNVWPTFYIHLCWLKPSQTAALLVDISTVEWVELNQLITWGGNV